MSALVSATTNLTIAIITSYVGIAGVAAIVGYGAGGTSGIHSGVPQLWDRWASRHSDRHEHRRRPGQPRTADGLWRCRDQAPSKPRSHLHGREHWHDELRLVQPAWRRLAVSYKESRRIWYRDLLSTLDVDDPDTLATQLSLLVDGAYDAALIRKDPHTMQSAIAAARTLLKAAGAQLSVGGAA